jgi:hypothetical protein
MKNLLYGLLALGMFSCGGASSSKPANELTSNDFESIDGWTGGVPSASLTKEKAHSGVYSVKVDPTIDYSLGYNNQIGKLSPVRVKKIKIHAWINLPSSQTPVTLVVEIKKPGEPKNLLWDGVDLLKEVKPKGFNKWVEVEKTFDLPENTTFDSQLLVYMWRGSSNQPAYLDDLQITKVE